MSEALRKGQDVRVRRAGSTDDWCGGQVALVSANGVSVGLTLDGGIRGKDHGYFVGALALLISKDGKAVGLDGQEYEVEVKNREPFELPTHCLDPNCRAVLMGGLTQHTKDCSIRALIEHHGFTLP